MDPKLSDEKLRKELITLIEETRNKIPRKSEMKEAVIARSFVVFALGCLTGIEMYAINLILTSKIEISFVLLSLFFVIGFLIGTYVEKIDLLKIKT
ncbi:MAG TPA: hypothetical protein PLO36_07420, partial [Methanofastidiosum sp.]|nr:hypothetical protein [Methanofastidiosum sp.]HQM95360.1 hypothetical protein [Methanofastidiosum sp.]HQQ49067.1 hypothetical protein [Methanofastidiosum sp.]